jgi:hypothetical protein
MEAESYFTPSSRNRALQHEEAINGFDEFSSSSLQLIQRTDSPSAMTDKLEKAPEFAQNGVPSTAATTRSTRGNLDPRTYVLPTEMAGTDRKDTSATAGTACTDYGPRGRCPTPELDEDARSSDAERRKLREFYECEGWLPGPNPSKVTRLRRKRAVYVAT